MKIQDLAAAVERAGDVQLVVNNAGILRGSAPSP
jgi:NAD(P)-dependent dehydrogenase (short-subunit alcohol dehydrogenase family)